MILEGIVTTIGEDGQPNISPMGPVVEAADLSRFLLKPFQTASTFLNLRRTRQGVFHITDNVEMFACAVTGNWPALPAMEKAPAIEGCVLADACRWHAFEVEGIDDRDDRAVARCRTVAQGRQRDFFGFNRAKHAVIEAAILVTRLHFLPAEHIDAEFERLGVIVEKTAGEQERRAFQLLKDHIQPSN